MADEKKPGFMAGKDEDEKAKKEKEEAEEKAKKSMIDESDLIKSAEKLEAMTKSGPAARKAELLAKAQKGEMTDAETAELVKSLEGKSDESIAEDIAKSMTGANDETFAKSIDVTDYVAKSHAALVKSLTDLAKAGEKAEGKRADETRVLAKALSDVTKACIVQGRMLKSIQQKLGIIATQPARGPRAAQTPEELAKAAEARGAQPGNGQRISPEDVMNTLEAMFQKSMEKDPEDRRGIAVTGEKYEEAISKFEQTRDIHPMLLREVVAFRNQARQR